MRRAHRQRGVREAGGFTLVELALTLVILAVATAIVLPVLSAMSSASTARASAGKLANFLNKRIAASISGGGPCDIILSTPSTVLVVIPALSESEASVAAATVLGRYQLSSSTGTSAATVDTQREPAETLVLEDTTIEGLYVRSAATGEASDVLAIRPGGRCDDALFVLSCSGRTVSVNVRGLAGRARVYDSVPEYLAASFEVSDETGRASR